MFAAYDDELHDLEKCPSAGFGLGDPYTMLRAPSASSWTCFMVKMNTLQSSCAHVSRDTASILTHPEVLGGLLDPRLCLAVTPQALLREHSADVEEDAGLLKVDAVVLRPLLRSECVVPGEGHVGVMVIPADGESALHHGQRAKVPAGHERPR